MELRKDNDRKFSLLYVEDDQLSRDLISSVLSLKFPNIQILTAEDGQKGLELYRLHHPDVVLTDIKMPVMDGITMAAEIRSVQPDAVIMIISAYGDTPQLASTLQEIRINYALTKPVVFTTLFSTVEKCFAEVSDVATA